MYMDRVVEVSKAANGYVVSCCVPLKPEAKSTGKMDTCCSPCGGSVNKQYIAKDVTEVADLVEDIIPLLDMEFKTENDFDAAFKKATDESSTEEKAEV